MPWEKSLAVYLTTRENKVSSNHSKDNITTLMSESMSELMSESMSELEKSRMKLILNYLDSNKEINSAVAKRLLQVEIKTAARLLKKAEVLNILESSGTTKNKVYFMKR